MPAVGGVIHHPSSQGLQRPLPLSQNGVSGPAPLPPSHQSVLVRRAGAEEDGQGQPGVCQEQPQHAGLYTSTRSNFISVADKTYLQVLPLRWIPSMGRKRDKIK